MLVDLYLRSKTKKKSSNHSCRRYQFVSWLNHSHVCHTIYAHCNLTNFYRSQGMCDSIWYKICTFFFVIVGLSFYTTEEELKNMFSPFGAIQEGTISMPVCDRAIRSFEICWFVSSFCILSHIARLVRDNQTGRPKGFGFVKYSSQADAEKAVRAMDGRVCSLLALSIAISILVLNFGHLFAFDLLLLKQA